MIGDPAAALLGWRPAYDPETQRVRRRFVRDRAAAARAILAGLDTVDDPDELAHRVCTAATELRRAELEILRAWLGP